MNSHVLHQFGTSSKPSVLNSEGFWGFRGVRDVQVWTLRPCTCVSYIEACVGLSSGIFQEILRKLSGDSQEAFRKLSGSFQEAHRLTGNFQQAPRKRSGSSQEENSQEAFRKFSRDFQEVLRRFPGSFQETLRKLSGDSLKQSVSPRPWNSFGSYELAHSQLK